ncbi:hypothetical protein CVT26_013801 [Gymnopilus dilepis]|uniref:Uncharacterized protein n=1 Tax=Gymnopilus dilepis TaxID=231916 RepID=A0A409WSY9_9AGAR|nr:hypothetical protein CVT26_013801 [Gymnopilus dilepis]
MTLCPPFLIFCTSQNLRRSDSNDINLSRLSFALRDESSLLVSTFRVFAIVIATLCLEFGYQDERLVALPSLLGLAAADRPDDCLTSQARSNSLISTQDASTSKRPPSPRATPKSPTYRAITTQSTALTQRKRSVSPTFVLLYRYRLKRPQPHVGLRPGVSSSSRYRPQVSYLALTIKQTLISPARLETNLLEVVKSTNLSTSIVSFSPSFARRSQPQTASRPPHRPSTSRRVKNVKADELVQLGLLMPLCRGCRQSHVISEAQGGSLRSMALLKSSKDLRDLEGANWPSRLKLVAASTDGVSTFQSPTTSPAAVFRSRVSPLPALKNLNTLQLPYIHPKRVHLQPFATSGTRGSPPVHIAPRSPIPAFNVRAQALTRHQWIVGSTFWLHSHRTKRPHFCIAYVKPMPSQASTSCVVILLSDYKHAVGSTLFLDISPSGVDIASFFFCLPHDDDHLIERRQWRCE